MPSFHAPILATRPAPTRAPVLRRCACGGKANGDGECDQCRRKRLQRSAASSAPAVAPRAVHDALRSPGRPLDPHTRAEMEPRFGASFAGVRIHAEERAAASAAAVGAQAYTVGRDLVFAAGKYAPRSPEGRRLIAHELAHVVQQSASADGAVQPSLEVGPADAPEEREADAAADAVERGGRISLSTGGAGVIRRKPGVDAKDSWDALAVKGLEVHDADLADAATKGRVPRASEAVRRMLATPSGATLANDLYAALCPKGKCGTTITLGFIGKIPGEAKDKSEAGLFSPDTAGAAKYTIWIKHFDPPDPSVTTFPSTGWPNNDCSTAACPGYTDPETQMAGTLFHEALHVWFVNTHTGAKYPTGHGTVPEKGQVEPEFIKRLRAATAELSDNEKKLHATQQPQHPPEREKSLRDLDLP